MKQSGVIGDITDIIISCLIRIYIIGELWTNCKAAMCYDQLIT